MVIRLSDEARQLLATFTTLTEATAMDCVIRDGTVAFVVKPDDMAMAIGPNGQTVETVEERLGKRVVLVEDAETVEVFVANALAPAAVYDVTLEDREDETVAIATVDDADAGVAIGREGRRIDLARQLVERHFDIDEIHIETAGPPKEDA